MPHFHVTLDRGDEYSVSFAHIRPTTTARDIGAFDSVQIAGMRDDSNGATICSIYNTDGALAACDASVCSPSDNFSRRKGREISLSRALQVFPRDARREFWRVFFAHEKGGRYIHAPGN